MFEPAFGISAGVGAGFEVDDDAALPRRHRRPYAKIRRVRDAIRARSSRADFFGTRLFSDPAWDILLDLYLAELLQHRVSVTGLGAPAGVAQTTALRWMETLKSMGLIKRTSDPLDARRIFVTLSPEGSKAMHDYFESLGEPQLVL